jgi:hypothetical protein
MRVSDLSVGLVAYYVGTEHLYALLVDQDGNIERFRLTSCKQAIPQIQLLLSALEQPFAWTASRRASIVRDFCQGWGRELIPPGDQIRRFDVLVVVPHHWMHGVPLHLVECYKSGPLGRVQGIAYCSSATQFERCAERNRARMSDPHRWTFPVGNDTATVSGPPVTTCLSYGVDVLTDQDPAYRKLAEVFANRFPDKAIATARPEVKNALDESHRIATAKTEWVHPDVICLVCHGYCDNAVVYRSGLLLATRLGGVSMRNVRVHGDTMLRVQDHPFAEIPLRLDPKRPRSAPVGIFEPEVLSIGELQVFSETDAQLVALFGCSTGTGTVNSADDFVTLANQWLKAGAASAVANLWEADFRVITEWVERFAKNWVELRQPKAIAAREATNGLLADRPDLVDQPLLWGSLSVLGDWL